MKLAKNWRKLWRAFSVQSMVAAASIQGAWSQLPHDLKSSIPESAVQWVTVAILVLGVMGRFVDQKGVAE